MKDTQKGDTPSQRRNPEPLGAYVWPDGKGICERGTLRKWGIGSEKVAP
jgi:hypothetical protein